MKIRCATCGVSKLRSYFPKGNPYRCIACVRLDNKTRRAKKDPPHGVSGYKNHGCRCQVCRIAWSEKMHAAHLARKADAVIAAKAPALTSWWLDAKPEQFTAFVEREQIARMKTSRFGLIQGRPYTTDEVSR